jgi:hypothetical protein
MKVFAIKVTWEVKATFNPPFSRFKEVQITVVNHFEGTIGLTVKVQGFFFKNKVLRHHALHAR